MSLAEMERFVEAVRAAPDLLESYGGMDAGAVAARLRADGYDVTDEEVAEAGRRGAELSEEQLDQVTGGSLILMAVGGATFGASMLGFVGSLALAIDIPVSMKQGRQPLYGRIIDHFRGAK